MTKEIDNTPLKERTKILADTLEKALTFYNLYRRVLDWYNTDEFFFRDDNARIIGKVSKEEVLIARGIAVGAYNELAFTTEVNVKRNERTRVINPSGKKIADDILAKIPIMHPVKK